MEKIINLLKKHEDVSDYKIVVTNQESDELFFVHSSLETVRKTKTESINVVVYVDHSSFRGEASFSVYATDDDASIEEKIQNAVETAKLIDNKHFDLPKDETASFVNNTNFSKHSLSEIGQLIHDVLTEAENEIKAKLNATEIFVYKTTTHLVNSQNIDKTFVKYSSLIETIPTYDTKDDSVELYFQTRITTLDKASLKEEILASLNDVTARSKAKKPESEISAPVILRGQEISQIAGNICRDQNYSTIYSKSNTFKLGDKLAKDPKYDVLNVALYGALKNCAGSAYFDSDGVSLTHKTIVKDNKIVGAYGSSKFAQYLNKPQTGNLSIVTVKCGEHVEKELRKEPYLECASFSGLQIDLQNDYIGGEVRLAYYFDGEKVTPVTGISISAKFSEVLNSLRFSSEEVRLSNYKGPKSLLVEGFKIF